MNVEDRTINHVALDKRQYAYILTRQGPKDFNLGVPGSSLHFR